MQEKCREIAEITGHCRGKNCGKIEGKLQENGRNYRNLHEIVEELQKNCKEIVKIVRFADRLCDLRVSNPPCGDCLTEVSTPARPFRTAKPIWGGRPLRAWVGWPKWGVTLQTASARGEGQRPKVVQTSSGAVASVLTYSMVAERGCRARASRHRCRWRPTQAGFDPPQGGVGDAGFDIKAGGCRPPAAHQGGGSSTKGKEDSTWHRSAQITDVLQSELDEGTTHLSLN